MDLRCNKCQKLSTYDEEFEKGNKKAVKERWDGLMDMVLSCKHSFEGIEVRYD